MLDATDLDVVVRPLRFSADVPAMREFLAGLGLAVEVSRGTGWATMVGTAGAIALHAADRPDLRPGQTGLAFEVADAEALAARCRDVGADEVSVYDEAYGRALAVRFGDQRFHLDERPIDLYGYQLHAPLPAHEVVSIPLVAGRAGGPLERLLASLGFTGADDGALDRPVRLWRGAAGAVLAVCRPGVGRPDGAVRLGVGTVEPLSRLADRLTTAGRRVRPDGELDPAGLVVIDPDGQPVTVAPRLGRD